MIRSPFTSVLACALALAAAAGSAHANLLANPGFESPITYDGPPFVGSWEGFSGAGSAVSAVASTMPRSGAQHLNLEITNTNNSFAGAFQDVPGLTSGQMTTFSGWNKATSLPLGLAAEFRIEWRNSVSDTEISRTLNTVPVLTTSYELFSLTAAVPAGADTARVVYAIQTFGSEPGDSGQIFLDDVSFIPTPATAALALGAFGFCGARRRR